MLAGGPLVDHHCHSLRAGWHRVGGGPWPAWRRCFTEAGRPASLATDVPGLLGYRHFLTALAGLLDAGTAGSPEDLERLLADRRDRLAGADPAGWLRRLLDHAGAAALLVDTGFGEDVLGLAELRQAAGRPVREVVRLEAVAEAVLGEGGPAARSLDRFAAAVEERLAGALDRGAVAVKSIAAYRGGLRLAGSTPLQRRQAFAGLDVAAQAARFDDPVLEPFLVRRAAELAAERQVPLQFHTGFGDEDVDLPLADPALLRPLLRDPRTECPVVLLHCYPFVGQAAYLAGTYPQVFMDLSLALPLAEPVAADLVRQALGLCPAGKLLAASDGHSFPEMHWWGATVWRRALDRVLGEQVEAGGLDEPAARELAGGVLAGNATGLYRL